MINEARPLFVIPLGGEDFEIIGVFTKEEDWREAMEKAKESGEFYKVVDVPVKESFLSTKKRLLADAMRMVGPDQFAAEIAQFAERLADNLSE